MAERRMFAKTIIDSDAFLDMPLSSQALYFHLSMRADDDGFINNPMKIQRMIGSSVDDLRLLITKNFVIPFESGVVVIKHWKIHNYIQKDRYKETVYKEEKALLTVKDNMAYTIQGENEPSCGYSLDTGCIQAGHKMDTQVRLGKDSIGEVSKGEVICAVASPAPAEPPIIVMPCLKDEEYAVSKEDYEKDMESYPAVDVMQEYKKMKRWLESNQKNKKTKNGMPRFINNWLSNEQNRGGKRNNNASKPSNSPYKPDGTYDYEGGESEDWASV